MFGPSLGAAVAVRVAAGVAGLITQRFDAGSRIAQVGSPVLEVHAEHDTVIKPALGREAYRPAPHERLGLAP